MPTQIGTHSGTFHCDEALACYMLRLLDEYKDAEIVRSRDAKVLDALPILVDVGAVYDPSKHRYDHHQRGFAETLDADHKTKLSSAGLVYKHFGLQIIKNLTKLDGDDATTLYYKVYNVLVEGLDGIDNGVPQYPADLTPAYKISTDLSARVGRLNPAWNEESDDADKLVRFGKAMEMAGGEFVDTVNWYAKSWLPARAIVKTSLSEVKSVHSSGEILTLTTYTVWKEHLRGLEKEMQTKEIKYVLYADSNGKWRVQCVPIAAGSFISRKPLPVEWRGIRNEELSEVSGISGCVFVHASGFIGGNATYDGALAMAVKSLETPESKKQKV